VIIKDEKQQLTLNFEPGLTERHCNLRDCLATSIYRRGLSRSAIELNKSPGNLCNELSDDSARKFGVDDLEMYLEKSRDFAPIYYLVEKFLNDSSVKRDAANAELISALASLKPLMRAAGID